MKVKELKKALARFPENSDVFMALFIDDLIVGKDKEGTPYCMVTEPYFEHVTRNGQDAQFNLHVQFKAIKAEVKDLKKK
jgi:ribosomal protein L25 (general stress protein Ctc)